MQELRNTKITIIRRGGQTVSGPLAPRKGATLLGRFVSSRTETRGKNTTTVFKEPVRRSSRLNDPRADLAAIKSWVALEEKIVHDYKEQKTAQLKSVRSFPKNPVKQSLQTPKKGWALSGFFTFPRAEARRKEASTAFETPSLTAVNRWVALEERIVHDYSVQEPAPIKSSDPWIEALEEQLLPATEAFSTQTAVFPSPVSAKIAGAVPSSKTTSSKLQRSLLVLGWLVAGVLVLLYARETFLRQDVVQELVRSQNGKKQLDGSYAALKSFSENQGAKIKWLNGQLRDIGLALKVAKVDKVTNEQVLGQRYRRELAVLRGTVQTQNAIVSALKAQSQAFEKIIDQVGMSTLPNAGSGSFSAGGTSVLQGEITSVNGRQGSVVINKGSSQGVRAGLAVTIFRSGIGLAVGSIDRVYPTLSVATIRNADMLQVIQEGDKVSFS